MMTMRREIYYCFLFITSLSYLLCLEWYTTTSLFYVFNHVSRVRMIGLWLWRYSAPTYTSQVAYHVVFLFPIFLRHVIFFSFSFTIIYINLIRFVPTLSWVKPPLSFQVSKFHLGHPCILFIFTTIAMLWVYFFLPKHQGRHCGTYRSGYESFMLQLWLRKIIEKLRASRLSWPLAPVGDSRTK